MTLTELRAALELEIAAHETDVEIEERLYAVYLPARVQAISSRRKVNALRAQIIEMEKGEK